MSNEIPPDALGGVKWEMKKPSESVLTNKEAREFLKISQHVLDKIRKKKEVSSIIIQQYYED